MSAKDYDYLFKFLIVGETGVGKSCLLLKFVEGTFSDTFISTIGVDFKIKTVPMHDRKVKLQIGVMLVFDITDVNSFLKVQCIRNLCRGADIVAAWLEEIHRLAPEGVKTVLVGTKKDLESKRMVETKEAAALANRHGLQYFEASSKTGENVEQAFMALAELCYQVEIAKKREDQQNVDLQTQQSRSGGWCSC